MLFSSLPNDKMVVWSKLKLSADNELKVAQRVKIVPDREENNVGKRENAGYQHFLFFPHFFSKGFFSRVLKSPDCLEKGKVKGLMHLQRSSQHMSACPVHAG